MNFSPSAYLVVAAVVVAALLVGTVTGRYILRRIAITLGVVAFGALFILDSASPL